MKVIIAVHHFPPHHTGGSEWEAYRIAATLQERGHDVRVICVENIDSGPAKGVAWEDDIFNGVRVRRLSFDEAAMPDPFRWEYDNPWIGDHLRQFLTEHRPDIFHLISGYLISASVLNVARQLQIPAVVSLMDYWFLCKRITMLRTDGLVSTLPINPLTCARCMGEEKRRHRWLGRIVPIVESLYWRLQKMDSRNLQKRQTFLRQTLNQADAIISRSKFLRSIFIEAGGTPDRIIFLRQGLDLPDLSPEALKKTSSPPPLRVGYIGQIAWHKGVHVLFEAARRMPNAPLIVKAYGDPTTFPDYSQRLRRFSARDRRLELAGSYPRGNLNKILSELDVIVVPSLWYENSPNVILEAFAYRTPVIASDLGGMAELVQDGKNGLLFPRGDANGLARQLQLLLDDPALLPALSSGIGPVKSAAQEIDELEEIYRDVIAKSVFKAEALT
jgi:glycosyltransferase involved in cell wall biosynthesis